MAILLELFEENISKFLSSLGLATREDVEIIEDRLGRLEERLADVKTLYKAQTAKPVKAPQRDDAHRVRPKVAPRKKKA